MTSVSFGIVEIIELDMASSVTTVNEDRTPSSSCSSGYSVMNRVTYNMEHYEEVRKEATKRRLRRRSQRLSQRQNQKQRQTRSTFNKHCEQKLRATQQAELHSQMSPSAHQVLVVRRTSSPVIVSSTRIFDRMAVSPPPLQALIRPARSA